METPSNQTTPERKTLRRSSIKNIPSFNDFITLTHDDDVIDMQPAHMAKPVQRTWSVESDNSTPRRTGSSFSETFTRALYEHMRGN